MNGSSIDLLTCSTTPEKSYQGQTLWRGNFKRQPVSISSSLKSESASSSSFLPLDILGMMFLNVGVRSLIFFLPWVWVNIT